MITVKYFFRLLIVTCILAQQSCNLSHKNNYETAVLSDIFSDLAEEIGAYDKFETPPAPDKELENAIILHNDISNQLIKNDTLKGNSSCVHKTAVIAVYDTLVACHGLGLDLSEIQNHLPSEEYNTILSKFNHSSVKNQALDLSQLAMKGNLYLKSYSVFQKGLNIWKKENDDYMFLGVLKLSRIYFDKKKQLGLFYCSFACGRLCGEELIVCIKKKTKKWIIDKTILLSVS